MLLICAVFALAIFFMPRAAQAQGLGPPDSQAPSVPTGLTATVINATRIELSWNAASDNVGVYIYQIVRGGASVGTVGAPQVNFADTVGLSGQSTYTYTVYACDFRFNCSAPSAAVSVTTPVRTNPDPFFFAPQNGVARNSLMVSHSIAVTRIDAPAPISIVGGEYSIDGGPFTANPGTVENGQNVVVRLVSSGNYFATTTATLTIGGVSASYNVTTLNLTVNAINYFPLAFGNSWVVRQNGVNGTMTVGGNLVVNGVTTSGISDSLDGAIEYLTNDALGLRLHRIYSPPTFIDGCGNVAETDTYSPPLTIVPAIATIGQSTYSNGVVTADVNPCGVFPFGYSLTSVIEQFERVSVPAGAFDALRVKLTLNIAGVISEGTYWFAPGVGQVKFLSSSGTVDELVSTNVIRMIPDEFAFAPQSNATTNTLVTSNSVTISGLTAAAAVVIVGGEYSINGGAFTNLPGNVTNGQSIRVRLTSPAQGGASVAANLTIGGVVGAFNVTTGLGVPDAPTSVTARGGFGSVTLTFVAPANNGGATITGYTATCTSSNGGVARSVFVDAAATSVQISGLTNGRSYTCSVTASNALGAGVISAPSGSVVPIDIMPILNLLLMDD